MRVNMKSNSAQIAQAVHRFPVRAVDTIHKSLEASAIYAQSCFRYNINAGATGALRRSVQISWRNRVSVRVEPTLEYAEYLEYGTRPHFPPVNALVPWARLRGINPYALQQHIGKHGTKPHPFLEKTFTTVEAFAVKDLEERLGNLVKDL